MFSVSEREPENGAGERPGRDPVNHHPPEEWRPGDRGDPMKGGPRPPGEPPHGSPPGGTGDPPAYGGAAPEPERSSERPPREEEPSIEGTEAGSTAVGGTPNDRPFGGEGELSEGPSGPGGAGAENTGYAPGYGDYPSGPVHYGGPGGYAGSGGYGGPGHAPEASPAPRPTPWGKILGIGCGVLLLLLLVLGGVATVMFFMAGTEATASVGPMHTLVEWSRAIESM